MNAIKSLVLAWLVVALAACGSDRRDGPDGPVDPSDTQAPVEVRRTPASGEATFEVLEVEFDETVQTTPASWTVTANGVPVEVEVEIADRVVRLRPRWVFVDAVWTVEGMVTDLQGNATTVSDWTVTTPGGWGEDVAVPAPFGVDVRIAWAADGMLHGWSYATTGSPGLHVGAQTDAGTWGPIETIPVELGGSLRDTLPITSMRTLLDQTVSLSWAHPDAAWGTVNGGTGWAAPSQTTFGDRDGELRRGGVITVEDRQYYVRRLDATGMFHAPEAIAFSAAPGYFESLATMDSYGDVTAAAAPAEEDGVWEVAVHRAADGWAAPVRVAGWPSLVAGGARSLDVFVTHAGETLLVGIYATEATGNVVVAASVSADRVPSAVTRIDVPNDMPERFDFAVARAPGHTVVGWLERRTRSGGVVEASRIVVRPFASGTFGAPVATPAETYPLNQIQLAVDSLGRFSATWHGDPGPCVGRYDGAWEILCDFPYAGYQLHHRQLAADPAGRLAFSSEARSMGMIRRFE